ncbi:acidic fibroblast growth factor intracellular-binding protein B-like [Zophobas morio]|uniref:acidic fibroblast growth factor intracellular-binding protein B-like n=1 Tax=Zophobas morio TaxID=2755281 RepID=UPI0030831B32
MRLENDYRSYSSEKTAQSEFNSEENESSEKLKYFVSEVNDNYRNFQLLLHFLKQPKYFETQSLFHISDSCKRFLVESYYEINDNIAREIIGKKLSARTLRESELSDRTGLSTYLCKLQFENIKRIYRFVEDKEGSLFRIIKENFYLSDKLSLCYSRIIFLCRYRIYCGKKRLRKYKLEDFMACAGLMMQYWSPPRQLAIKILDDNFFLNCSQVQIRINPFFASHGPLCTTISL